MCYVKPFDAMTLYENNVFDLVLKSLVYTTAQMNQNKGRPT